jgi:uncharacterized protein (DUF2126 family)
MARASGIRARHAALDVLALLAARRQADLVRDAELVAEEGKDTGQATAETAKDLLAAIADNLGIEDDLCRPPMRIPANGSSRKATCPTT